MTAPLVSILIPHFQTPDLAKLCLRAIRRHTRDVPYEVIVIDNGSQDGTSLEYLRQVEWIRLIERTEGIGPLGQGHKEAIDLGIAASAAPYVLAIHTDTIPIRDDWLRWHVAQIEAHKRIGAVGTYKLEIKSSLELALKWLQDRLPKRRAAENRRGDDRPYVRSHCALYRRDLLLRLGLQYDDPQGRVAGLAIHEGLEAAGYESRLLSVSDTLKRVVHLNHGTMILLPELGARPRTIRQGLHRIRAFLSRPDIQAVLHDATLDRGSPRELLRAA